ncbi:MAG: TonB-dependent receptor [Burkholderiales bacterium]
MRQGTATWVAWMLGATALPGQADTVGRGQVADTPALVVGEPVLVRGRAGGAFTGPDVTTSVDILSGSRTRSENVNNSWELFGLVPGVMLTGFRQGTTSGKPSLRAFNGEGEINAVKLLIDGVPSNSNDGNLPYLDAIFPIDIAAIEVVRGTNDPRHGLHNIAGNVNVVTRTGGDYAEVRTGYGSFASRDVQAAFGAENGGFSQNYSASYRKTEGYRHHADSEKASFSGKWFHAPGDGRVRAGLIARHYWNDAEEPGYLVAADARRDPRLSYAFSASDMGRREADTVSGHLEADLRGDLSFSAKAYLNRLRDQRWVKFSAAVSQQERIVDEMHHGLLATLTYRPGRTALGDLSVETGVGAERQENRSLRFNTTQQVRQTQTRDQVFAFDIYGVYAQAVLQPVERLKLIPAFRIDRVFGDFTNALIGRTYPVNDYGFIQQPKFSALYALSDSASLYGNYGRTFQVGVGAAAYKVTRAEDLKPSINTGWELGLKLAPAPWLDGRVAVWRQLATDEARRKLNDPANDSENIGRTRRSGIDLQANARPSDRLSLWLSYSIQQSEILQAETSAPASQGKEIDHVPRYLVSGGLELKATPKTVLSAWVNAQGDYYLERTNTTAKYGRMLLVNVGATHELAADISVSLQIRNLLNRYYEYVWHDGTQSLHAPGDARGFYGAVSLKF